MHLLTAQAGGIVDGLEPVDLEQAPGDIVVLSAADTELSMLARCYQNKLETTENNAPLPSLRLGNLMQLGHNYSVDLYIEKTLKHAKLIIIRLLGGAAYWQYGLDEVTRIARANDIKLAVMAGCTTADKALMSYNTIEQKHCDHLWDYCVEGGAENLHSFLDYARFLITPEAKAPKPAQPLAKIDYLPFEKTLKPAQTGGKAAVIFYRALLQADDLEPIYALIKSLQKQGLTPLPVYVSSLKDSIVSQKLEHLLSQENPDVIINLTGFALSKPASISDTNWQGTVLDKTGAIVLQAVLSGMNEQAWQDSARGLGARDIAMNIALPELDGRIFSRAISFKAGRPFDNHTQSSEVYHKAVPDRVDFITSLAQKWSKLRSTANKEKRIALIMANYPSPSDDGATGRMANGVGLDTPQSTLNLLQEMQLRGYHVEHIPHNTQALMALVSKNIKTNSSETKTAGQTKTAQQTKVAQRWQRKQSFALHLYLDYFNALPPCLQQDIRQRWGNPEDDINFCETEQSFHLDIHLSGNIAVGFQPARFFKRDGFSGDEKQAHHDMTLVPTHHYLAFYFYLRHQFGMDAIIHMGKHGNLEWLPGKALGLSKTCLPEIALGSTPHIYPFIVNDPGEGTQAKRRTSAVIIDHLTPPLTRAESYGALRDLEALVDEYYEASSLDPRRTSILGKKIINMARSTGIDKDCGIALREKSDNALAKLDNFLCDLKDLQIRDGLHIFGKTPEQKQLNPLLLALTRLNRGDGKEGNASLITALSHDLGFDNFDPLSCAMSEKWTLPKPDILQQQTSEPWRTNADSVERFELLALKLIEGAETPSKTWHKTLKVLAEIKQNIKPRVVQCGADEMDHLFLALNGRFVPPGSSGAPTRGRLDVLPTGRNFYSLDSRIVPTQSAWELGWLSAQKLVTAYLQEHGDWPRQFGITAWGTANMRTGGDDIAQAMALIGVKPLWDANSRSVTGFEVISLSDLGRPRIDVVIRLSGFFRDAFPVQLDLLDSAVQTIAALDEPFDMNPLAQDFQQQPTKDAPLHRLFGSAAGRYGAGIEDMLTQKTGYSKEQLAQAYLKAGSFSYGGGKQGVPSEDFETLLKRLDGVVQNQDAREFDILDSDAFAAYEGGMAAAKESLSGTQANVFHNDHSNPANPVIRTLQQEIARVVRGRAANPQWIDGVKRHGYKGGSEMAQASQNLLNMAQTTGLVQSEHFDLLFEHYLIDPHTLSFLEQHNPDALRDIAQSLSIARDQNFWYPRRNSAHDYLTKFLSDKADEPNT